MAITKPTQLSGYPSLKVVNKDNSEAIPLSENFLHLYTDTFELLPGEKYYTEFTGAEDTALFLWSGDTLLKSDKNSLYFVNIGRSNLPVQLIVKGFDASNAGGKILSAGNYSTWKSDSKWSNGTNDPVGPNPPSVTFPSGIDTFKTETVEVSDGEVINRYIPDQGLVSQIFHLTSSDTIYVGLADVFPEDYKIWVVQKSGNGFEYDMNNNVITAYNNNFYNGWDNGGAFTTEIEGDYYFVFALAYTTWGVGSGSGSGVVKVIPTGSGSGSGTLPTTSLMLSHTLIPGPNIGSGSGSGEGPK